MSNTADLFLDQHRIRVVKDLDVAPGAETDATVRMDPRTPSLTIRSPDADGAAELSLSNDQGDRTPVTLTEDNHAGFLEVTDGASGPAIRFDARSDRDTLPDPEVELSDADRRKASVKPGRINLLFQEGFPALAADGDGTLTLTNRKASPAGGRESTKLDGSDGALVLSTTPEGPRGDTGTKAMYGGGELVLQSETDADADIQVHVQGEDGSDYGADVGNRPRIHLNGPEATVALGRHRLGTDRPSKPGTATIRSETGTEVLRMGTWGLGESEVVFTYSTGSGSAEPRGKLRSHPEGLMVYDAGGNEALLFSDSGNVETRKEVTENANI